MFYESDDHITFNKVWYVLICDSKFHDKLWERRAKKSQLAYTCRGLRRHNKYAHKIVVWV